MHVQGIRQSPAMKIMFLMNRGTPESFPESWCGVAQIACTQTSGPTIVLLATQLPRTRANIGQCPYCACSLPFSPDDASLIFLELGERSDSRDSWSILLTWYRCLSLCVICCACLLSCFCAWLCGVLWRRRLSWLHLNLGCLKATPPVCCQIG